MKAATRKAKKQLQIINISIHAAREGGDQAQALSTGKILISIHAAREGGDLKVALFGPVQRLFQSTPPVKAATQQETPRPREARHFNPRRP